MSIFTNWRLGQPIVVVSGLPRSGTSMMMQMLEAGGVELYKDGVRTPDEDNPKGYHELEQVKELDKSTDKSWVRECRGKAVKVISMLLEHLPPDCRYRVIFLERSIDEVIRSQNKMLERSGESGGEADDEEIRAYFERHLKKMRIQLRNKKNFETLFLPHRTVIEQPEAAAPQIATFLKKKMDTNRMASVVDKSLYRNRS